MKIIDLNEEDKPLYNVCLEDWNEEFADAGNHKQCWCEKMLNKGLRVKLAVDDNGAIGGMIHYLPIEHSFADGKDLYFIPCVWVHGHKRGRGDFQKKGFGKALLKAAEDDVKQLGAKGIAAWGLPFPIWMRASWFKKNGYVKADKQGFLDPVLMWKPFSNDAFPPKWIKKRKITKKLPGKVTVTSFINGWCPAQNIVHERAKRASASFGDKVVFEEINTFEKEIMMKWGISDALFIDEKEVRTGPPPSYEKIRQKIEKQVRKLKNNY